MMRCGLSHQGESRVMMEALEDRRLMSASVTSMAQEVDEVRLVSKASVALVNLVGSEFEGRLL
ncbi:MAG TPA: hypothetical protein VHP11_05570, partial [Tepidisphaeraceae bacterium]|nr:hypothetical protein [Tepidisphaeraceae bacterium]